MVGVWSESVTLQGALFQEPYALGNIVLNCIFFAAILYTWWRYGDTIEYKKHVIYCRTLKGATTCLAAWYAFRIVDLFIFETRVQVKEGYFMLYTLIKSLSVVSEVLILMAAHRAIASLPTQHIELSYYWDLCGEALLIALSALALYSVSSYAADILLGLKVSPDEMMVDLEGRKSKIELAYYALQFVESLLILAGASAHSVLRKRQGVAAPSGQTSALIAMAFLFVRSFSELVIVARYSGPAMSMSQAPLIPQYLNLARSCVYGFTSFICLRFFTFASRGSSLQDEVSERLAQGRHMARKLILEKLKKCPAITRASELETQVRRMTNEPWDTLPEDTERRMVERPELEPQKILDAHRAFINNLHNEYKGR